MAIFQDTRELERQERHIGMDTMKGNRKVLAAAMGYKSDGTKNIWGRVLGTVSPLFDMGARLVAGQAAKGSDASDVMKATNDEFWSAKTSRYKFNFEAAKLAAKLAGGDSGNNMAESTAGQNLINQVTQQGTDEAIQSSNNEVDELLKKTDSELVNSFGEIEEDEKLEDYEFTEYDKKGEFFYAEDGSKVYKDDLMEQEKLRLKKEKRDKQLKQVSNIAENIPLIGDTASAGLDLLAANRNFNQESKSEVDKYITKTAKDPQFNLL